MGFIADVFKDLQSRWLPSTPSFEAGAAQELRWRLRTLMRRRLVAERLLGRKLMRNYTYPTDINVPLARAQATKRRAALVAAGCSTYVLGWRDGLPRILCLCCGLGSQNSRDISDRYCGFCRTFHAEWTTEEEASN